MKNSNEIDGFKKVCDEMVALKARKSGDYANSWRALGINGLNYQIARKFTRIWINKDRPEKDINCEMLRDTYIDMAVYAIMSVQLIDENDKGDKIEKILKNKL